MCDFGHRFVRLPDHPMRNGLPRCPHCMAAGLDSSRQKYAWFINWFVRGGLREEIMPNGHIQAYSDKDVDCAISHLAERS